MQIYTMGFTKKSAETFFELIRKYEIEMLIDIRLNNQSQLAGFTKGRDLAYFLNEICHCQYDHEILYAPTKDFLDDYKKHLISWDDYVDRYNSLIIHRNVADRFKEKYMNYNRVLLLCSEPTPEHCHRRLLAEYLRDQLGVQIIHI